MKKSRRLTQRGMLLEREKGEDTGVGGKCVSITNGEMESHAEHHMQFHG